MVDGQFTRKIHTVITTPEGVERITVILKNTLFNHEAYVTVIVKLGYKQTAEATRDFNSYVPALACYNRAINSALYSVANMDKREGLLGYLEDFVEDRQS